MKQFKPYIPADRVMPELTPTSVILGIILAIVFGGANAYLGLRVGMTVSASIPAAVLSMGIVRMIMRRDSILENNMVQTIGSAGESLAAGAIFTLPTLFMWADENPDIKPPSFLMIAFVAICGGLIGVLFMIPLRTALIVEEHGTLPFPEGTACAEVLLAGETGGHKSMQVFSGLGISAVYKFIADGLHLFPSEITWTISSYKGSGFGMDVLPALVGVGYICGAKVASYLLSGAVLGWFVIMPLLVLIGGDNILFPASYRILRGVKNRFGSTNEIGVFEMRETGLAEVKNPSEYMLNGRPENASGSVVACTMEGTRPLLIELQALVCHSNFGIPRRQTTGTDFNRVNLLMAVLEKRSGGQLSSCDAYVNITGGIKIQEPAIDLGIVLAILSSFRNKALNPKLVSFVEVGLSGEVRAVSMAKQRVAEAEKLGFEECVVPLVSLEECKKGSKIRVIGVSSVQDAVDKVFG